MPESIIDRLNGGEGGIRTRGTRKGYNALAGRRFQPLTHLSICGIELYSNLKKKAREKIKFFKIYDANKHDLYQALAVFPLLIS